MIVNNENGDNINKSLLLHSSCLASSTSKLQQTRSSSSDYSTRKRTSSHSSYRHPSPSISLSLSIVIYSALILAQLQAKSATPIRPTTADTIDDRHDAVSAIEQQTKRQTAYQATDKAARTAGSLPGELAGGRMTAVAATQLAGGKAFATPTTPRLDRADSQTTVATTVTAADVSETHQVYGITETALNEEADAITSTLLIDYDQQAYGPTASAISSASLVSTPASSTVAPTVTKDERSLADILRVEATDTTHPPPASADEIAEPTDPSRKDGRLRDLRDARLGDKVAFNASSIYQVLFKKKPYSKFWTAEQKWDDIFSRFMAVQGQVKNALAKNFLRDIEYYADVSISRQCADDLKFIQDYAGKSTNFRWLMHMVDSTGKSESGMLTGNMANLGHVVQCIRARAPSRPSNDSFNERFFEEQTRQLGERFRGKYCLASVRPVLPEKPRAVSRFSEILDTSLLSNISFMGEPVELLKQRATQTYVPESVSAAIDRQHARLDQIPFESELFDFLIRQRNVMFTLPRFMGVCYPSSCSKEDIRSSIQKSLDGQHQVADVEFECEQEEYEAWEWFSTPRLISYVFLVLLACLTVTASLVRYIIVDKLRLKRVMQKDKRLATILATLDMLSMDKCAGILFVKTKPASPMVDIEKPENNRSTSIDALKGFLILMLIYSQLVHLGCLPIPFMWSKWSDAMFPFYRSLVTQIFLNTSIWTESFYLISAYLIATKVLEDHRPLVSAEQQAAQKHPRIPNLAGYVLKRYVRLVLPMLAFITMNYVWPRLSNGFVMQDQANKLMAPCDSFGWTNFLMFHNHYTLNETCLWPSHASASFFQLHILSYPILLTLLASLRTSISATSTWRIKHMFIHYAAVSMILLLALLGLVYPALVASQENLTVPFLIDYIDYDNYRRVLEWTVLPTHNHLTSYMIGLLLAYLVVKRRARWEEQRWLNSGDWHGVYIHREGSFESVMSSTRELHSKPAYKKNEAYELERSTSDGENRCNLDSPHLILEESEKRCISWMAKTAMSLLAMTILMITLTSSWYWNGLGQPMSSRQTFWFVLLTKMTFVMSFAYLFYKHFATRRNCNNPWMITRFLVPIGRMSLMLFYLSWLVIWFDLLSSLYQWHPSHYFVFEKFNEIVFMSLVLTMLAYGAFEGTFKRIDYAARIEQLSKKKFYPTNGMGQMDAQGFETLFVSLETEGWQVGGGDRRAVKLADGKSLANDKELSRAAKIPDNKLHMGRSSALQDQQTDNYRTSSGKPVKSSSQAQQVDNRVRSLNYSPDTDNRLESTGGETNRHLSIADQYKLNAELRANYSFASIGLYESAGATDELPQPGDPQTPATTPIRHR